MQKNATNTSVLTNLVLFFIEFYFEEHSEVDKLLTYLLYTQIYSQKEGYWTYNSCSVENRQRLLCIAAQ